MLPAPSGPDAPPVPSGRPAAFGRPAPARRRRSRRAILAVLAAVLVLAAAAVGAYLLHDSTPGHPLATAAIAAAPRVAPVTGSLR
jgi:hypothetical protein